MARASCESFQTNIMDLPEEVLRLIFSKLSTSSVLTSAVEVCTGWKSIVDSDFLFWKRLKISIDCDLFLNQTFLDPLTPPSTFLTEIQQLDHAENEQGENQMVCVGEGDLKKVRKVRYVKLWNFNRTSNQHDLLLVRILEILIKTCKNIVRVELSNCLGINSKHFLKRLGEQYKDIYELKFGINCVYSYPYDELVHFNNLRTFVSLDYSFVGKDLNTLADSCVHLECLWIINSRWVKNEHFISFLDRMKKVIKEIGIGFRVTDEALCKMEECEKLETLFIGDARGFSEAVLDSITKLENLRYVCLQRANCNPDALATWILSTEILTKLSVLDLTGYYHIEGLRRWASEIQRKCSETQHRLTETKSNKITFRQSNLKSSQAHWMFRTI